MKLARDIANGEHRSKATAALLQRMGVRPGLFDFLLIGPDGRHYWLELKRAKAPLSEAQERFRQDLVERTVTHGIARSFDGAVSSLREWGGCGRSRYSEKWCIDALEFLDPPTGRKLGEGRHGRCFPSGAYGA